MESRAWGRAGKIAISLVCLLAAQAFGECTPSNQSTKWGDNENVVIEMREPMGQVHGTVLQDYQTGKAGAGVLVEVYNHPEVVLEDAGPKRSGQTRIIGCVTDERGRFAFKLKTGDYELRASNGVGWKVTSVVIKVRKGRLISLHRFVVQLFSAT